MWAIQGLSVPLAGVRKPDAQALGVFLPFPRWGAGGNTDQKEKTRARHAGFRTLFKHPVKPPGAGQQESGAHRRTQRCTWPANWLLSDGHLVAPREEAVETGVSRLEPARLWKCVLVC